MNTEHTATAGMRPQRASYDTAADARSAEQTCAGHEARFRKLYGATSAPDVDHDRLSDDGCPHDCDARH